MDFSIRRPPFPLSEHVELIWHRTIARADGRSCHRVYPNGAMGLFIDLHETTATFSTDDESSTVRIPLIAGPWTRSFFVGGSQFASAIGVVFRPGGASRFFRVRAHELHNTDVALRDLHSEEADRLLNDVCSSTDAATQMRTIERYLLGKLRDVAPVHPAVRRSVAQLARGGGVPRVREIQRDSGLSHTRFIQLFREHVGLTPKLFCRVRRFRMALDRIQNGMPVNWAALATDCGYYDQAHLIHDFRAFAGLTPAQYQRTLPDEGALRTGAAAS